MNEQNQNIIIITTGGTIEKTYDETDGSLLNRESTIRGLIESRLRLPYTNLNVFSILNKDSLEFGDNDRELICSTVKAQSHMGLPIVVLHGTDTMADTADFCFQELGIPPVPVVFTGAMKPMGFQDSDATQNVTEALLAAKLLSPGIYISFHNRIFEVPGVRKNKERRTFEVIDER